MRFTDAVNDAGISYRQADYWRSKGYIQASTEGHGTISEINYKEAAILSRTAILVRAGMKVPNAAQIARVTIEQCSPTAALREGLLITFKEDSNA